MAWQDILRLHNPADGNSAGDTVRFHCASNVTKDLSCSLLNLSLLRAKCHTDRCAERQPKDHQERQQDQIDARITYYICHDRLSPLHKLRFGLIIVLLLYICTRVGIQPAHWG